MSVYRHILVAVDLSVTGEQALRQAAALAQFSGARLSLLHVIEHFPEDWEPGWIPPKTSDPQTYFQERAEREMARLAERVGVIADVTRMVTTSRRAAQYEIIRIAQTQSADLIVVGSHGIKGVEPLLGSVASGVLHRSPCDVLAVRANP